MRMQLRLNQFRNQKRAARSAGPPAPTPFVSV
jgi:hypothetical protein